MKLINAHLVAFMESKENALNAIGMPVINALHLTMKIACFADHMAILLKNALIHIIKDKNNCYWGRKKKNEKQSTKSKKITNMVCNTNFELEEDIDVVKSP